MLAFKIEIDGEEALIAGFDYFAVETVHSVWHGRLHQCLPRFTLRLIDRPATCQPSPYS